MHARQTKRVCKREYRIDRGKQINCVEEGQDGERM